MAVLQKLFPGPPLVDSRAEIDVTARIEVRQEAPPRDRYEASGASLRSAGLSEVTDPQCPGPTDVGHTTRWAGIDDLGQPAGNSAGVDELESEVGGRRKDPKAQPPIQEIVKLRRSQDAVIRSGGDDLFTGELGPVVGETVEVDTDDGEIDHMSIAGSSHDVSASIDFSETGPRRVGGGVDDGVDVVDSPSKALTGAHRCHSHMESIGTLRRSPGDDDWFVA